MELVIYEELYQTPIKICLEVNCNENVNLSNTPLRIISQNNYNFPSEHLLRNHQNRTVIGKTTKRSQQGLEKRAEHQKTKIMRLTNELLISRALISPIQSNRSEKRRRRNKYKDYSSGV